MEVPATKNFAIDLGDNSCIFAHNCIAGHSERNALINAAREGVLTKGSTLYCNCNIPCKDCLIEIINAGVSEIVCIDTGSFYDEVSEYLIRFSGIKIRMFIT